MKRPLLLIAVLAMLTLTAAECSFSTANIADAYLSTNQDGTDRVTSYSQESVFYAIVVLANAPDDSSLKASWYVVEAVDTEPNLLISEVSTTGSDGQYYFTLTNEAGFIWPIGSYRVDLYLNDKLDRSLEFSIQ